jgi:hypothetical protein
MCIKFVRSQIARLRVDLGPLTLLGNRNISGLSFGNTSSKILGEVTIVTNCGAQAESGI